MKLSYQDLKAVLELSLEFLPIDFFFADTIERYFPLKNQEGKIWLSIMHKNVREGNYFLDPIKEKARFQELPSFEESIKEMLYDPSSNNLAPVIQVGDSYMLKKNFDGFFQWLNDLKFLLPDQLIENEKIERSITGLNAEQNKALIAFFSHHWLILTGGPGRGKTFTAKQIVKSFLSMQNQAKVVLAAPTGKATENLYNALSDCLESDQIQAMTLHSLLGLSPNNSLLKKNRVLDCDLLIIDECSMMDFHLFSCLLKVLEKKTKVLFIGDLGQLPPIAGFSPLHLLIDLKKYFKTIGFAELKEPMRTDKLGLLKLTSGLMNEDEKMIQESFDCKAVTIHPLTALYDRLEKDLEDFLCPYSQLDFKKLYQNKVIASHNVGSFGADAINQFFIQLLAKRNNRQQYLVPILFKENQDKIGVFNGKLGFLSYFHPNPTVYISSDRKLPLSLSPAFDLAFAISIHKSQGSEFEKVILSIQEITEPSKELLYTAVSRAKKEIAIFGDKKVFFQKRSKDDSLLEKYRELTDLLMKQVNT